MSCGGGHLGFPIGATAELSLTLDPIGKMFQNASSLKPLGQLKPNCPGMIYKVSVFYADWKSKMATTAGYRFVLQWWPSWISNWHKKQKLCIGPSNDHSWAV
jgi:hypothetical protein